MTGKYDKTLSYDSGMGFFLLNRFNLVLNVTYLTRLHRFTHNKPSRIDNPTPRRSTGAILELFISIVHLLALKFASLKRFLKVCLVGVKRKGEGKYCKCTKRENVKVKTNFTFAQQGKVILSEMSLINKRGK